MGRDVGPISDVISDRFDIVSQGISAELIAEKYDISRESMDRLSLDSHTRALNAIDSGYFNREVLAVDTVDEEGNACTISTDEGPRRGSNIEKLATLKPAFKGDGRVTAASSSQISDGAAAVLLGTADKASELGVRPRAKIRSMSVVGSDPTMMLTGPGPATELALKKAGLTVGDIDLFEVNEAFASVVLAWQRDTGADLARTNVNGGAMALGHPLGCSGARLVVTLLHELERRDQTLGLATLCIGFGMAVATVIERV
jgi:acetyl-CoA acetyltransferase family protein